MLKATLTFGGQVSPEGLQRIAECLVQLSFPINGEEFEPEAVAEEPEGREDPAWALGRLHDAITDQRPFTVTVWEQRDSAEAFQPLEELLTELSLMWRRFAPPHVEETRGLPIPGSITLRQPAEAKGHVLQCASDAEGNPYVPIAAVIVRSELLHQAMRAQLIRWTTIPPLAMFPPA